jgi:nitroimidazol reductase NimA-like FMN-containing flavoprotein (pyridoxamine 5'-phosphate oxidase superfamily)
LRSSWPERLALDSDGLRDLLARRRYAVLATGRPDGRPHAAPIAFLVFGGSFWFGTVEGVRLRNVRERPWGSLVVMEGEADEGEEGEPHRALTVEGPVTVHEGLRFDTAWARLQDRWLVRFGHAPDWAVAFIELVPRRVYSYAAPRGSS